VVAWQHTSHTASE